ncbi:MAG: tyrosine-type recombinase/integrase [Saprospiraceae bacterium]|nr:tyrosine-type recombinase/integrase [Saprospiraceae bacterium]
MLKKIPRPRKEKKLPTILSKEDVVKIIENAPTYKQQVLLTFIYTTGMRLSESINVCFEDIDSNRLQIRVNKGKAIKIDLYWCPLYSLIFYEIIIKSKTHKIFI